MIKLSTVECLCIETGQNEYFQKAIKASDSTTTTLVLCEIIVY